MARRRRGGFSRSVKKTGATIWTTLINEAVTILPGATKTGSDIVTDSDWSVIGGQERATILRIRGWFAVSIAPAAALTDAGGCFGYIGVYDADELSLTASAASTYKDEDIMTTFGHVFPYSNISQTSPDAWHQVVDVKAMRKIRTGQECRFVLTNETPLDLEVSLVLRALVKKS